MSAVIEQVKSFEYSTITIYSTKYTSIFLPEITISLITFKLIRLFFSFNITYIYCVHTYIELLKNVFLYLYDLDNLPLWSHLSGPHNEKPKYLLFFLGSRLGLGLDIGMRH